MGKNTQGWVRRDMVAAFMTAAGVLQLACGNAFAQSAATPGACEPPPARAASVQGTVEVRRVGDQQFRTIKLNDTFCPGDVIRVQERSRADVTLLDQSVLRLNANSTITIEAPKERRTGVIDLVRGTAHFFSRGPNSLEVKTPFTVAGVRGTEFLITLEGQQALLTVFEGTVVAQSPEGSLTLTDGQAAAAAKGKPPVLRTVVRPRDAVHWALYYPPVVYFKPGEAPGGALEKPAPATKDARVHVDRAQRLLAVGSVDQARAEIDSALKLAPNDANALSLQSIMAVVQGDKDRAYQIAQAAVSAAPNSGTALLARSFAEQARFDLEGARASVQRAVELEPNNALAWARLAEMHSSFGEIDKANTAAQRAVELQPDLSRTQMVLGFARLTAIRVDEAKQSFEKAIALDQADPLSRLGLGLAKIRGGDLEAGARDLEVAASLDSSNGLVRSYLGKTYYEEKRGPLDEREFNMAKQLDPRDPTPWFYDAIAKQTTNRPVEALESLEKARELNDNRAVYRSQLLLDSDDAARAASQARIFSDLGFQQRALVEGWSAINRDPTNFSAHRFLSDSYSVLPRHEIARVSELLQSQLLAPISNTPLQPRLAESNLQLISSSGPATASFNEFNPLFTRNGFSALMSALGGNNDTQAGEIVVSGLFDRFAFSAGYSKFRTDGFRANADQDDEIGNLFGQFDISPQTSVQAEYRHRNLDRGDVALRFFPTSARLGERTTEERDTYRVGVRHSFSPQSTLLGSLVYQDAEFASSNNRLLLPVSSLTGRRPEKAWVGEVQHLYRSPRFNLTSGAGYFDISGQLETTIQLVPQFPFLGRVTRSTSSTDLGHFNAYVYGVYKLTDAFSVIGGLSYDNLDGDAPEVGDRDSFNPKVGFVVNITPQTALRAAAFKVIKRTLVTDQTLEPTQVAGFNQFYDDANATKSWRYGLGLDHKATRNVFLGAEYSYRDVTRPFLDASTLVAVPREQSIDEYFGRAYAFWAPHPWIALSGQYQYEQLKTKDFANLTGSPAKLDTHRVPLGVRFFHPTGISAGLTATYVDQSGTFVGNVNDSDRFWLVDAALSYRLPKRYGTLSVGAANLTDQNFKYFDTDTKNPLFQPSRTWFARLMIALP